VSIFYSDDLVTLLHGDCLQLDYWLDADLLITDPPYGIGFSGRGKVYTHDAIEGDLDTDARDQVLHLWGNRPALVFGHWQQPHPAGTREVLIWDKGANPGLGNTDLPWGRSTEEIYVLGKGYHGRRGTNVMRQRTYPNVGTMRPDHPTPKPVALIEALILRCPPGVIADPFAGSGATLIAAKALGRHSIGVEIDERYCEIAAQRLQQEALQFT
jgi:hypothetical protein